MVYKFHFPKKYKKTNNNSCAETLKFTLIGCLTVMIVCLIIDEIRDRVSECSMVHNNCRAVKPLSFFTQFSDRPIDTGETRSGKGKQKCFKCGPIQSY